jgi:hydroxymethylpyrimidine pyrophosphatase-like HAD family hydrolase/energy-coupling factor transporter ATP-binding protein EcfA2
MAVFPKHPTSGMQYVALAADYDGTIAHEGVVPGETVAALDRLRRSGRKLILVTGRQLDDLMSVFDRLDLFDRVVAENGALLYDPQTRGKRLLADAPKPAFAAELKRRGVTPLSTGDVIVSTCRPHETDVLAAIAELGLDLQVIFNKGSVMVLPAGVNKESGLRAALEDLDFSEHNVIGVGDAENDLAFLNACELPVAVANALPAVKEAASCTTRAAAGAGVAELCAMVLDGRLPVNRHRLVIGHDGRREVSIPAYGNNVLVAGSSGSGKSSFVAGLFQTLIEKQYQVCLIDPEGDYESFGGAITIGDEKNAPAIEQILQTLHKPEIQAVINLIGVPIDDRPGFFIKLLPRLQEMRLRTGRPHWIVIDEAHHMLPAEWAPESAELAGWLPNIVQITVHPDRIPRSGLEAVNIVIATGERPDEVIRSFPPKAGTRIPTIASTDLPSGQALVWFRDSGELRRIQYMKSSSDRKRHLRKYALGELGEDRSFYFRGPEGKLNLRAQNLATFLQLADGVDDQTWLYHLRRGDYSRWFREGIKDPDLARDAERAEKDNSGDPRRSRGQIREAVEHRYTAPA